MTLNTLVDWATDKTRFTRLADYIEFAEWFLDFKEGGLQATIVSQNEPNYRFFQYRDDGHFNITRPINSELIYERDSAAQKHADFLESLRAIRDLGGDADARRRNLIEVIYTAQQSIGATLDALPAGQSNTARKLNGDLFERKPVHLLYEDRLYSVIANDGSVPSGVYVAQNGAASLNRILKAQSASGVPANVHVHADGTVHEAH